MTRVLLLAVAAALATSPAHAQQPLLHVAARDATWLEAFRSAFELEAPELPPNERYELVVAADGKPLLSTAPLPADAPLLWVEVRPAAWFARGQADVERARKTLSSRATGLAALAGLPPRTGADLVGDLFALCAAIDVARITVAAGAAQRTYDVRASLAPVAESPFADWLAAVAPAAVEPPLLTWDDAMVRAGVTLQAARLRDVAAPFLPLAAAISGSSEPDLLTRLEPLDGTFGITLAPSRLGVVHGLRDAVAFVARATDPAMLQAETQALARADVTAIFTPNAMEHRDVELLRSHVTGKRPFPGLADDDGALVSYGGRIGSLWVQVGGRDAKESVKAAIDAALDGRLRAARSDPGNRSSPWLTLEVDLARVATAFAAEPALPPIPDGGPRRVRATMSSSSQALSIAVDLR